MRKFVMKNFAFRLHCPLSATGQQADVNLWLKIKINTLPI